MASGDFIRPHPRHPRYLAHADGRTFIPVGCNLCFPRFYTDEADGLARMRAMLSALADAGGNFGRLWLSHPFFDVEPAGFGRFDPARLNRLRALLDFARERGLRLKLTLEHFRTLLPRGEAERFPGVATFHRTVLHTDHGGPFASVDDYLRSPAGHDHFRRKLDFLAAAFADDPAVFGWELWNEMDAVKGGDWHGWSALMLGELRQRFPRHLVMQSLGSFDTEAKFAAYRRLAALPGNDLLQVHRYLDPGAPLAVCHGSMDVLVADAIRQLRALSPGPVVLAEGGAVEPRHAAPSRRYEADTQGELLHDLLFSGFFAGGLGGGQAWHWDFYVQRHALWWHFSRFAEALAGIDPAAEAFEPVFSDLGRVRVHTLVGRSRTLAWVRAADSAPLDGIDLHLPAPRDTSPRDALRSRCYLPWEDRHLPPSPLASHALRLPAFTRSLVVCLEPDPAAPHASRQAALGITG